MKLFFSAFVSAELGVTRQRGREWFTYTPAYISPSELPRYEARSMDVCMLSCVDCEVCVANPVPRDTVFGIAAPTGRGDRRGSAASAAQLSAHMHVCAQL